MNKLPKINNKKADLSVVVFVFLVLLLFSYTLYSMASNRQKVSSQIAGYGLIEERILEKKDLEYRLFKITEECLIESYYKKLNGIIFIEQLENKFITDFENNISECLKKKSEYPWKNINSTEFPWKYGLYSRIHSGLGFELKINGEKLNARLNDFTLSIPIKNLHYSVDLNTEIEFERSNLLSIDEIKRIIGNDEIKEKTKNLFEIGARQEEYGEETISIYTFKSKKQFLINNTFTRLDFTVYSSEREIEDFIEFLEGIYGTPELTEEDLRRIDEVIQEMD